MREDWKVYIIFAEPNHLLHLGNQEHNSKGTFYFPSHETCKRRQFEYEKKDKRMRSTRTEKLFSMKESRKK
jgi:hypothetical protein